MLIKILAAAVES